MDKLEIKQGSFIQQTQYFIPVEIDLSFVPARLGISDFFTYPVGQRNTRSTCPTSVFTGIEQTLMSRPARRKPPTCRFELTTLVVIGTDCTGNQLFQLNSANIPILFTNPSYFNLIDCFCSTSKFENDIVSLTYIIGNQ